MDERDGTRDLRRIKWLGLLLPVGFVWAFELVRFSVLDEAYPRDTVHAVAALLMAVAVVAFAAAMASIVDRAQRRTVAQNRDLTLTHAVSAATRASLALPEMLAETLAQVADRTGALAGDIRVDDAHPSAVVARHPRVLAPGLSWVGSLLDAPLDKVLLEPTWTDDRAVDSSVLDIPLLRRGPAARVGRIRLVFHPAVRPDVSASALADIAGEIATAIELGRLVDDLRRRERERAALYEVAIQLTRPGDLREILDGITRHARNLLAADRAVACLADRGALADRGTLTDRGTLVDRAALADGGTLADRGTLATTDRLALADDGSTCTIAHAVAQGVHPPNPACPLREGVPSAGFASRPLRGPDRILGELCVVRRNGVPFTESDRAVLGALADMAAIAVRTARLREAEEQWTILAERDRIARELHDSFAQVLGVIHLRLRAIESTAGASGLADASGSGGASSSAGASDAGSRAVARELGELADIADEAYRDVREAILGLRETISPEVGLEGALRDYLRKYTRQTGIRASLVCAGDAREALPPRSEVQLLRVVQEALTNVRKHAGATEVFVRMDCRSASPVVSVEDDGVGFDPATAAASLDGGFGLTSMRERVHQIGGTLDVHTAPGEGTRVVVRLGPEEIHRARATPAARAARR